MSLTVLSMWEVGEEAAAVVVDLVTESAAEVAVTEEADAALEEDSMALAEVKAVAEAAWAIQSEPVVLRPA